MTDMAVALQIKHRRHRTLAALAALAVAATGLAACSGEEKPDGAVKAFLDGWATNKLDGLALLRDTGESLPGAEAQTQLAAIEGDLATRRPKLTVKGKITTKDDNGSAAVAVSWPVADNVNWEYDTTVRLRLADDKWKVFFSSRTVHPDLGATDKLTTKRVAAERGSILDAAGQPIVTNRPVVVVGLEPRQITDMNLVVKNLGEAFRSVGVDVDVAKLPERVKSAKPDAFIEVVTLRREVYDQIRPKLRATVGTVFRESSQPLAPSAVFARSLLGRTGEVTKEIMDKNPGKYKVGDLVGQAGLQQRYDDALRGTPGVTVVIPTAEGRPEKALFTTGPKAGTPVKTTLDPKVQNAADAALGGETRRSALVAVRVSDGAILAVANGPNGGQVNTALSGQVPPGSTFKAITALGLLDNGSVTLDSPVNCPKTLVVDGATFKNSHNMEMNNPPFRKDFSESCNTAFASLADKLGGDGLANTAKTVGIGVPWDIGIDVYSGKVSANGNKAERAAAAFGQGTTLVSPVALAGAAAGIARGQWKQPSLVLDPAPAKVAPDGPQLKPESVGPLKTMMREVVTTGTANQLKGVTGDLHGKTGTAEFDNNPANTHSFFMGWRGDVAFCVFVENGGASTSAAVPIAGKFFQTLG